MKRDQVLPGLVCIISAAIIILVVPRGGEKSGGGNGPAAGKQAAVAAPKDQGHERPEELKKHTARACVSRILRGDAEERAKAVSILRNLGKEGLEVLREVFADQGSRRKREAAAYGLAVLGDARDKDLIADAFLETKHAPTPLMAAAAAELKDPHLVQAFLELRVSKDWRIREAAARALRAEKFPDLRDVMPLLADDEPRVRAVAESTLVGMLDRLNDKNVEEVVTEVLASGGAREQQTALKLCARVDKPWTVTVAMRALKDSKATVRAEAIDVLGRKGDRRAQRALVGLMYEGQGRRERVRAASALGTMGGNQALRDHLAKVSRGKDPLVALAASRSLAAQGDPRGIEALLDLREVRKSAARNVDEEDEMLLRKMSDQVLTQVQGARKRRANEDWKTWWRRVRRDYRIPPRVRLPEFPDNH